MKALINGGHRNLQKLADIGLRISVDVEECGRKALVIWQSLNSHEYFIEQVIPFGYKMRSRLCCGTIRSDFERYNL